jgi:hypothetical protein
MIASQEPSLRRFSLAPTPLPPPTSQGGVAWR